MSRSVFLSLGSLLLCVALAACDPVAPPAGPDGDDGPPWIEQFDDGSPRQPDVWRGEERPRQDDPDRPPAVTPTVFSEPVLSGDGRYLLYQRGGAGGTCLEVADLDAGTIARAPDLCELRWITAAPDGARAWLLDAAGDRVAVLRLADRQVTGAYPLEDTYTVMEAAPGGAALALSNRPVDEWSESQYEWNTYDFDMRHLAVIVPETGAVHEQTFPFAVRDVAFSPVDGAVLVAMSWWKENGQPEAQVHFMDPVSGVVEDRVTFPNCADELAVSAGDGGAGAVAILSPRQCFVHPIAVAPDDPPPDEWPAPDDEWDEWDEWDEADPASVIDLETRTFVGNLPGFGPVAIAPDSRTAVAFSRQQTLMRQWNVFQRAAVGLVVIRLADLYWEVVEYGGAEPDFFFAGRSDRLLLHDREDGADRVVRLDVASLDLAQLAGPPTRFERRAVTPGGGAVYSVYEGRLRRVVAGAEQVEDVPLDFTAARVLASPAGDRIVVTEPDVAAIHVLGATDAAAVRTLRP